MSMLGSFYGIGVGPGPAGFLPVAAVSALQKSQVIFLPRAESSDQSISASCLTGLNLPAENFREVKFSIDPERAGVSQRYDELAQQIADELIQGRTVSYVTIGDSLTYSTYSYALQALLKLIPELPHHTIPGVTSYCAAAAAFGWPLGQGKERVLILPCPDDTEELWNDIVSHDIVILMKIGKRLNSVVQLLKEKNIAQHCALAGRIGLPGEFLYPEIGQLNIDTRDEKSGYLSTILIRRQPPNGADGVDI